jgi:hypothetical protein
VFPDTLFHGITLPLHHQQTVPGQWQLLCVHLSLGKKKLWGKQDWIGMG